jgi:hypothetical protein
MVPSRGRFLSDADYTERLGLRFLTDETEVHPDPGSILLCRTCQNGFEGSNDGGVELTLNRLRQTHPRNWTWHCIPIRAV